MPIPEPPPPEPCAWSGSADIAHTPHTRGDLHNHRDVIDISVGFAAVLNTGKTL
jgi:hypothetical protein